MLHLIGRLLLWLRGGSLKLLIIGGLLLIVWGILSPVGTLVWWVSVSADNLGLKKNKPKALSPNNGADTASSKINCYIVFMPGVGDFSADQLTPGEAFFLNRLVKSHPNCVGVWDVFPYSVANKSLGGQRLFAPLWRIADRTEGWLGIPDGLIKIRNLWRFAISADPRYGSVYNQGIATAIIDRMNARHPIPTEGSQPIHVVLVGTSGGVQVAIASAPYLDEWLDAKITVVSVGGVFTGNAGFNASDRVHHVYGDRDWIDNIGFVFPTRWEWNINSPFNQARLQNRYTQSRSGTHTHDGDQGYFGEAKVMGSNITYVELTLQDVNQLPIWSEEKPNSQK